MLDDAGVEGDPSLALRMTSSLFKTFAAARVTAVKDRHVVLPGHCIDCIEEAQEVLFGVDVLLAMGGQEDILPFLESETLMDVAGLDLRKVLVQHFSHR